MRPAALCRAAGAAAAARWRLGQRADGLRRLDEATDLGAAPGDAEAEKKTEDIYILFLFLDFWIFGIFGFLDFWMVG